MFEIYKCLEYGIMLRIGLNIEYEVPFTFSRYASDEFRFHV